MSILCGGKKYAYFDNAATTFPKPQCVYDAMDECARNGAFNAGRGQYTLASAAHSLIAETRSGMEKLFGCTADYSCVFTDSATSALNTIISGLKIEPNANVYITPFEHNAVLRPLYARKKETGFSLFELEFDTERCVFDTEKIAGAFKKNPPDVLIMTHASNAFGFVTPVEKIAARAKSENPLCAVAIDCAQTAGLFTIEMKCGLFDYAVFAGHKTLYGPFGIAGFLCRKDSPLPPFLLGGTGIDSNNPEMPEEIPLRFEAGSRNINAVSGLNAALKEIEKCGTENLRQKEETLRRTLISELERFPNIRIVGKSEQTECSGIVSAVFENYSPDEIGNVLDTFNICVRTGLSCAPSAHKKMGTFPAGTVRFSLGRFTSEEDFEMLRTALEYIRENG